MHDVVMLLKIVLNAQPSRLMEVGSFRGYTALLMAQHMHEGATLVTVDRSPDHGEAYRDAPEAAQIERRVGETGPEMFSGDQDQSYDLIFLDAGHFYEEVRYDTELLLPLLADDGYLVWHDYANWGYFTRHNGVPEYLNELAASLPIAHIAGTGMAIHSPQWGSLGPRSVQRRIDRRFVYREGCMVDRGAKVTSLFVARIVRVAPYHILRHAVSCHLCPHPQNRRLDPAHDRAQAVRAGPAVPHPGDERVCHRCTAG